MKNNKIKIMLVGILTVIALTAGCFFGCVPVKPPVKKAVSFEDAFDYSALGGIGLLSTANANAGAAVAAADGDIPETANPETANPETNPDTAGTDVTNPDPAVAPKEELFTQAEKDKIIANLAIAQNTLKGGVIKSEVTASDREGYEFKYTITATDIKGENKLYAFYYNNAGKDGNDDLMDGIVEIDGVTYSVKGEKSVENDEDGTEEEYKFTVMLDEQNYTIIEQEIAADEQEFTYKMYENGVNVYETSVEYETDENGEVELSFSTEINGVETEYSYEFYEDNTGKYVEIETENGDTEMSVEIKIVVDEQGEVGYEFLSKEIETETENDDADED